MTDTWDELWEEINWDQVTTIPFITERIHKIKAKGDMLFAKIEQIHECIGDYESKEWCGHCLVDAKCAQITMVSNEIKEAFAIHYSTLHDSAWMDTKKMLKALDETAEKVKGLLVQRSGGSAE